MKFKLIKQLAVLMAVVVVFAACDNAHPGFKKNENGIYYKIISSDASASDVKIDSGMFWKMGMSYGTEDSLLFDFAQNPTYFDMPFAKPEYQGDINEAFALLAKGDSAHIIIRADSFFMNTARQPEVPELFKETNDLHFFVKIADIVTAEELQAKREAELEVMKQDELANLAIYLSENYPNAVPTESGLFIIKDEIGKGKYPKDGDFLKFDFSISILNGELIYDTKAANRPAEVEKGKPFDTDGFNEALNTMRVGDAITVIASSKLAFGAQGLQGRVMPYTTILYTAKLNSITSKAQHDKDVAKEKIAADKKKKAAELEALGMKAQEAKTIAKYISDNKVTVTPTSTGLYYIQTEEGTGIQAVAGDKVKVHYRGTLLDGTPFDASYDRGAPYEFTLGKGQVIKGWDQGIALMKVGGKGVLIVPSELGYGAAARGGVIHAYAPLKFEVELVEVTKAE